MYKSQSSPWHKKETGSEHFPCQDISLFQIFNLIVSAVEKILNNMIDSRRPRLKNVPCFSFLKYKQNANQSILITVLRLNMTQCGSNTKRLESHYACAGMKSFALKCLTQKLNTPNTNVCEWDASDTARQRNTMQSILLSRGLPYSRVLKCLIFLGLLYRTWPRVNPSLSFGGTLFYSQFWHSSSHSLGHTPKVFHLQKI